MSFQLCSSYEPTGDQPQAIQALIEGIESNQKAQTLLGVTGSGKTFTMANVIATVNKPILILSHNKTLAAQLYTEFKSFFPKNAVEYFVSYYDYYQPEAYIPSTGVYIEKDLAINEEIEKMRLSTAASLLSGRRDVIVIASVSCIYGMSNPADFRANVRHFRVGDTICRDTFLSALVALFYSRNETNFQESTFRVRGDIVDLFLAYGHKAYRFFFFGDKLERIHQIDPKKGKKIAEEKQITVFPANQFIVSKNSIERAITVIEKEMNDQIAFFLKKGCKEEADRLEERTRLDMDMMRELGYCSGIENYSRCFDGRQPGERPYCLIDYFPNDFLMIIDESHVSIPQIVGMWGGDRARKKNLVEYGFRIPAAKDNRPLTFTEFESLINQVIYVSATPADYELAHSENIVVEQVVRPTGLLDPVIEIHPSKHQIDSLLEAIQQRVPKRERILITTLTKLMAEELTKYLESVGVRCRYIHAEVKTLDRVTILNELQQGVFDVLVGVNLLREGLDLPEVSLVAILDADKEGFLRNFRSLIQMIGRAARHVNGKVILYADKITPSIKKAVEETKRRREKQDTYNKRHGITPTAVTKAKNQLGADIQHIVYSTSPFNHADFVEESTARYLTLSQLKKLIKQTQCKIEQASISMDYLKAEALQQELKTLQAIAAQKA